MSISLIVDKETKAIIKGILEASIYGQCYPFAIAMHRGLDWKIIGLFRGEDIIHSGVRSPEGMIWDGRGVISEEEFIRPYSNASKESIRDITEEDLFSRDEVSDHMIESFLEKAQAMWPDLPWKGEIWRQRVVAFTEELEAISRKYKLWVCGPVPAALPVLFRGYDDEKGYQLSMMADGVTHSINRDL